MAGSVIDIMKVAISSVGKNQQSLIDNRFGRCQNFLIFSDQGKLEKTISNPAIGASRGAGVQAAQVLADEDVDAIITGNMGPTAFAMLEKSGIKMFLSSSTMKAEDAFNKWKDNDLEQITSSVRRGRFGPGGGRGQGQRRGRGPNQ